MADINRMTKTVLAAIAAAWFSAWVSQAQQSTWKCVQVLIEWTNVYTCKQWTAPVEISPWNGGDFTPAPAPEPEAPTSEPESPDTDDDVAV